MAIRSDPVGSIKTMIRKWFEAIFGVTTGLLFFIAVVNSNAMVPDSTRHWFFRSATILNLSSEAFVVAWTIHEFRCGHRLRKLAGAVMAGVLGLCLIGTLYEYFSSYGSISRMVNEPNFLRVCAGANGALESATKTSQNVLTSVEMSLNRPKCARYSFSARGLDGALWSGHGGQFDSDEIKWTIKRNGADASQYPSIRIEDAYVEFLAREPEIATYNRLKISWNTESGRWEKSGSKRAY